MTRNARIQTITFFVLLLMLPGLKAGAQDQTVRSADEILADVSEETGVPTVEMINELFENASAWDAEHGAVADGSREALRDLGLVVIPTVLETWIDSIDTRKRVELDNLIVAIGNECSGFLIPYLTNESSYVRKHAAYLIGDIPAVAATDDPLLLGPHDDDLPAIEALVGLLEVETDWHVTTSALEALGAMRDPGQIDRITSFLSSEEQAIRLSAVVALGSIPSQDVVLNIISAFGDPQMTVREAAVLALSTETMGNLAFESLMGTAVMSPIGIQARISALESLKRYLDNVSTMDTEITAQHRSRAFDTAASIYTNATRDQWVLRGYAIELLGYTYDDEAVETLEIYLKIEAHPFVLAKINEAIDRCEDGRPEPLNEE